MNKHVYHQIYMFFIEASALLYRRGGNGSPFAERGSGSVFGTLLNPPFGQLAPVGSPPRSPKGWNAVSSVEGAPSPIPPGSPLRSTPLGGFGRDGLPGLLAFASSHSPIVAAHFDSPPKKSRGRVSGGAAPSFGGGAVAKNIEEPTTPKFGEDDDEENNISFGPICSPLAAAVLSPHGAGPICSPLGAAVLSPVEEHSPPQDASQRASQFEEVQLDFSQHPPGEDGNAVGRKSSGRKFCSPDGEKVDLGGAVRDLNRSFALEEQEGRRCRIEDSPEEFQSLLEGEQFQSPEDIESPEDIDHFDQVFSPPRAPRQERGVVDEHREPAAEQELFLSPNEKLLSPVESGPRKTPPSAKDMLRCDSSEESPPPQQDELDGVEIDPNGNDKFARRNLVSLINAVAADEGDRFYGGTTSSVGAAFPLLRGDDVANGAVSSVGAFEEDVVPTPPQSRDDGLTAKQVLVTPPPTNSHATADEDERFGPICSPLGPLVHSQRSICSPSGGTPQVPPAPDASAPAAGPAAQKDSPRQLLPKHAKQLLRTPAASPPPSSALRSCLKNKLLNSANQSVKKSKKSVHFSSRHKKSSWSAKRPESSWREATRVLGGGGGLFSPCKSLGARDGLFDGGTAAEHGQPGEEPQKSSGQRQSSERVSERVSEPGGGSSSAVQPKHEKRRSSIFGTIGSAIGRRLSRRRSSVKNERRSSVASRASSIQVSEKEYEPSSEEEEEDLWKQRHARGGQIGKVSGTGRLRGGHARGGQIGGIIGLGKNGEASLYVGLGWGGFGSLIPVPQNRKIVVGWVGWEIVGEICLAMVARSSGDVDD